MASSSRLSRTMRLLVLSILLPAATALAQQGDRAGEHQTPLPADLAIPEAPPLSPEAALDSFRVAEGLRVELVAAEPLVIAPVAMEIGPDGRMWVVEMPGYMNDVSGSDELEPTGRIVILEDLDQDGRMDTRTVFLDELVLPRAVAIVPGGALVVAPPNLLHAIDHDGDGRADSTIVLDDTFAGRASPEHAGNGLRYGMDNWLHCSQHPWEYRFIDGVFERRAVPAHGQWGLTSDAWDRWYYTPNSYPLLVDLIPKHIIAMNPHQRDGVGAYVRVPADTEVHPIRINPGVNRGYADGTLNADFTLANFTAACGPEIYLDTVLGDSYSGDAFICEPSGNTVEHRNMIHRNDAAPEARSDPDIGAVMASTDERFRPVYARTGGDGALYVLDMYRGILQHRIFMTTFLRNQVLDRGLEHPVDRGRIWRLVPDDGTTHVLPTPADAAEVALVNMLAKDNGPTRILAQQQLIQRQSPTSVPLLADMAAAHDQPRARAHALWTLHGMGELDYDTLRNAASADDPNLRVQAMRIASERNVDPTLLELALPALDDADPSVRRHAAAALATFDASVIADPLVAALARHPDDAMLRTVIIAGAHGEELDLLETMVWHPQWNTPSQDHRTLLDSVARAAARDADPTQRLRLLEILASLPPDQEWMSTTIATRLVEVQRLRSASPKTIELSEAPFDWNERLDEQQDLAGGLLRLIDTHTVWPGRPGFTMNIDTSGLSPLHAAQIERGMQLYTHCTGCHQADGMGLRGFYPPLSESPLVTGPVEPLVAILLHGIEGPLHIDGTTYDQPMPPAPFGDDADIAAIASFVRMSFGNDAGIVDAETVGTIRSMTSSDSIPWTLKSLEQRFPDVDWNRFKP